MSPNPKTVAGGVAAAVLGGGVAAALLLGPNPTSAAPPTSSEVVDTDDTDDGSAESGGAERSERLRELLQPLVDSGALTAEEADAIVAELVDVQELVLPELQVGPDIAVGPGFPGHREFGPMRGSWPAFSGEVVAEAIGIDAETLREELRGGATIAEIAEANGIDPQTVIDALVADYTERVTAWIEGEEPAADEPPASDDTDSAIDSADTTETTSA
jgi:hypothetical protein